MVRRTTMTRETMNRGWRMLGAVLSAALVVFVPMEPAQACSCAETNAAQLADEHLCVCGD